ncbi:MAG: dTDP-4-dehydrorhamnose reductase, partial [Acidobacteria bacterium]|nr:dTDP-4-dehydrorhamnose reductase [Acidobacteriota bacterium]
MKILLIGANGQLGCDLVKALSGHELVTTTHQTLDVVNFQRVRQTVRECQPQAIINTSAFHKVDVCETEILPAFQVNAYGVRNLALAAREVDAGLIHFSTDYVFEGNVPVPRTESDPTNPISAYGISKLAGEKFACYLWPKCLVIRSCGLYGHAGSSGKGGNFVETMLKKAASGGAIEVVDDQRLTPTSTRELARKVAELLLTNSFGLFHITASGDCSWFEFAREIFSIAGIEADLSPTTSEAFKSPARRPAYSVLENA